MNTRIKKTWLLAIAVIAVSLQTLKAQTTIDTARNTALQFFRTYDSIPYLTFDVKYTYFSDTVYSDFSYETMRGAYTMSGKKAKYSLGDVDYLQNDSFLVAVYNKDQVIVVGRPVQNAGASLPMREALDSLLQAYSSHYDLLVKTVALNDSDTYGYIKLQRKAGDTVAQYNKYIIEFNIDDNTLTKVEFEYTQPGLGLTLSEAGSLGEMLLKNSPRRRTLRIEFTNYRFDNFSDKVYNENNIIWEEDGEYKPVEKYKEYKVYNTRQ